MRKTGLLVLIAAVLLTGPACAWGPATHAYIAMHATGLKTRDVIYGAIAPDICQGILFDDHTKNQFANLTHVAENSLPPGEFATGFVTHNGNWGGDFYAHRHHNPKAPDVYNTIKIRQIRQRFGLSSQGGEGTLDMVMDFLVRREAGPELGELIVDSCQSGSRSEVMVRTFAQPLAERVEGMSTEEAQRKVRRAARIFRVSARIYGRTIAQDEEALRKLATRLISVYLRCDMDAAKGHFDWLIALCEKDYLEEMERECASIRAHMEGNPKYILGQQNQ